MLYASPFQALLCALLWLQARIPAAFAAAAVGAATPVAAAATFGVAAGHRTRLPAWEAAAVFPPDSEFFPCT